jgi:pimeloyl-ACP methyl ester carboxylesterase
MVTELRRVVSDQTAVQHVHTNGITVQVAVAGAGPAVLLLHGWPHTWQVWSEVIPGLAAAHRVIAPDLRGVGGSNRAPDGYDAANQAADVAGVLDALAEPVADVVAIDAGVPIAFLLALLHPDRVRRLVLMEATLPGIDDPQPGPDPRWWFGFHQVPGLAETVLAGNEPAYLDHFLTTGTAGRPIAPAVRDAIHTGYAGVESLRCGFENYRAMPTNAEQVRAALATRRLTTPTLAIGADAVGDALHRQLTGVADDLTGVRIPDCAHIIPLHRPAALLDQLTPFLAG